MRTKLHARRIVLANVLALAALTAACGGGDDGNSASTLPAGETVTPELTVPAGAARIEQQDLKFKPNAITAKVGETVYFLNRDSAIHNIKVNGKDISGKMKKGDTVAWRGSAPGDYKITCDYHPMKATITLR